MSRDSQNPDGESTAEASHLTDAKNSATRTLGAVYRAVWDRPDWQRSLLGTGVFLLGVLLSEQIQTLFDTVISIVPLGSVFATRGPFFASNRFIVAILGVTLAHQVRSLNTIRAELERMSSARADGGTARDPYGPNPETETGPDGDDSPGGGALGGAIAGAALGSAYGPGGTIGGAVLGAVLGDSLADRFDERERY